MTVNILNAFINIAKSPKSELKQFYQGKNRANDLGKALEIYIKDAFCNTINEEDSNVINERYNTEFSYAGNANNPPDFMINGGDAIEVKKLESFGATIQLNSSHPKDKLFCTDSRITEHCRTCESESGGWEEKDIVYAVGVAPKSRVNILWLVYGDCFAAEKNVYAKLSNKLTDALQDVPDIQFKETNELGGVECVDPLGITYLRVRGMWILQNPSKIFDYIVPKDEIKNVDFATILIMKKTKYDSFGLKEKEIIESLGGASIDDVRIKDPNNPAKLMDCKLIKYIK